MPGNEALVPFTEPEVLGNEALVPFTEADQGRGGLGAWVAWEIGGKTPLFIALFASKMDISPLKHRFWGNAI